VESALWSCDVDVVVERLKLVNMYDGSFRSGPITARHGGVRMCDVVLTSSRATFRLSSTCKWSQRLRLVARRYTSTQTDTQTDGQRRRRTAGTWCL